MGPSLQERNFAIETGMEPASINLSDNLKPVIRKSGSAYLTVVVSEPLKMASLRNSALNYEALTAGSGFLIDADRAITAGHVALRDALKVEARGPDGRIYNGKVIAIRPQNDIAMLQLRKFSAGTPVKPATEVCLKQGDPVFSLGKPHAMGDTARLGTVDTMSFGQKVTYQGFGYPDAMVLKMATRKGESGGPVFNAEGELVGMIVSTLSDQNGAPLNLAHAVTLPAIADFICRQGDCPAEWARLRTQSTRICPAS
ncbi:MAG: serine protease [Aestuariivirgaceae bacterium]|nr:serine protease [Aestuariivirgaceae bacterium]